MADSKITALASISTSTDPAVDPLVIVDVSDTSMAATGTTKKVTLNNLLSSSPTATGAFSVTGLVTAGSATITGAATVGTTLGVTGASTLASVGVTGAATVGTTLLVGTNATLTNGNVIIGTSGKGIDFSATANSSGTMTSELLADYEEGTWTATLTGTVANPTIPVTATGRYTKIGRVVSVSAFFSSVITTGASGRIQITGLPFTNNSSITSVGTAAFNGMATFTGSPFASLATSDTTVIMFSSNSAASYAAVNFNAGTTQDLWVSLNYTVA